MESTLGDMEVDVAMEVVLDQEKEDAKIGSGGT